MKIRTKLTLFFAICSFFLLMLLGIIAFWMASNEIKAVADANMADDIEMVKEIIQKGDNKSVVEINFLNGYWLEAKSDSKVLYESPLASTFKIEDAKAKSGTTYILKTEKVNITGDYNIQFRMLSRRFADGLTITLGQIIDYDMDFVIKKLLLFVASATIIVMFFVYFFATFLLKPVRVVAREIEGINEDTLSRRITVRSNDEIGQLVRSLNRFMDSIEHAYKSQRGFVSLISHELKTPLSVIKIHLELALQDESIAEVLKQKFSVDLEEIGRLNDFINKLLLFTKLSEHALKPQIKRVYLNELLDDTMSVICELAALKGVQLAVKMCDEQLFVDADRSLLHRAIFNICENAVKFSKAGDEVKVHLCFEQDFALIKVEDCAGGIDDIHIQKIFDKYYCAVISDDEGKKSGIGLSLAKMILELFKAQISVSVKKGVGSSFEIRLPLSR